MTRQRTWGYDRQRVLSCTLDRTDRLRCHRQQGHGRERPVRPGPALDLYRGIIAEFPEIELIASGGVRTMQDISDLDEIGCSGVIVGRAIYEGTITTEEAARYAR